MKESTCTLTRAIGSLLIAFTAIIGIIRTNAAKDASNDLIAPAVELPKYDWSNMSEDEKRIAAIQINVTLVRKDTNALFIAYRKNNFVNELANNNTLTAAGSLGTLLICASFFMEWSVKRRKEKQPG